MAKNYSKWIGGALGWAFGGPLGAMFGFAVGSMFDTTERAPSKQGANTRYDRGTGGSNYRHQTTHDDFVMSLLALSAAIMKADGVSKKSELDYIKTFFKGQFGESKTREAMYLLKDILKRDIPIKEVAEQIRYNMEHPLRLQLLHYMFNIAKADGHVHQSEVDLIERISNYLGISTKDYKSIEGMFHKDVDHAYAILEITKNANDSELKKAYRKMAVKYHPDKVSHLGEEFRLAANEKFIRVKDAYEQIKKERGIK
jgi:DnaJ like chaperone protein